MQQLKSELLICIGVPHSRKVISLAGNPHFQNWRLAVTASLFRFEEVYLKTHYIEKKIPILWGAGK